MTSMIGPQHLRIVEIEVGLVGVEAVPVIGLRHRVPASSSISR